MSNRGRSTISCLLSSLLSSDAEMDKGLHKIVGGISDRWEVRNSYSERWCTEGVMQGESLLEIPGASGCPGRTFSKGPHQFSSLHLLLFFPSAKRNKEFH